MIPDWVFRQLPWQLGQLAPLLFFSTLCVAIPARAQVYDVNGRVFDQASGMPVSGARISLAGTTREAATDSAGAFRLAGVPAGTYVLRVSHLAYGERSLAITVPLSTDSVSLALSETAIALKPLTATAISGPERQARGAGYGRRRVTRQQLVRAENTNMTLADVLQQQLPNVRVRRLERVVGSPVCIELRTIRTLSLRPECLSPAVYLDGVPINNPTQLYGTLDVNMIESLEVIPAAEAGARFGTGAQYGALLIETRRPGAARSDTTVEGALLHRGYFDWAQDGSGHRTGWVLLSSAAGTVGGAAAGILAAQQCLRMREQNHDSVVSDCALLPSLGVAAAALVLPALGSSYASRIAGRTQVSEGRIVPAAVGAMMMLLPGYGLIISSERSESTSLRMIGYSMVLVGTPAVTTAADYLFRQLRGNATGRKP